MGILATISQAVQDGDAEKVGQYVTEALSNSMQAGDILDKGLIPGIQALGERFKNGEAYLPEILISVRAMNRGVGLVRPHLNLAETREQGTVVLGTVEGDLHDIGKNLVKMMLEGNGFRVIDLGVDVPTDNFVHPTRAENADIVAISALLTITMTSMPVIIDALEKGGLRDKVRVMIGGAPITREFADSIGAEGFAEDCVSAVDEAKRLIAVK